MIPTKTKYPTNYEQLLSARECRLIRRIKQIINQRGGAGAYAFTLIVNDDQTWELIPPPPEAERIG
jgi:hypothetical protein